MKNSILLLLLFTGIVNGQIVNIPDANFKAKLLAADTGINIASNLPTYPNAIQGTKVDLNSDGEIQVSEALAITYINVNEANITSLQGIEQFTNLKWLQFYSNNVSTIDISPLVNLTSLWCSSNQLTELNVDNLTNLTNLNCSSNNLTTLNLNSLSNLTYLNFGYNQLTNINLSNVNNLTYLGCYNNQLTSLNISNLNNLQTLYCNSNLITSLDVSNNNSLFIFFCGDNKLSTLDVSNLTLLNDFHCGLNQITSIDVTNATNLQNFGLGDNYIREIYMKNGRDNSFYFWTSPNLQFICVDDMELDAVQAQVNTYAPQAIVNSYCSFSLGGNYNTITGNFLFDYNNNGCDTGDYTNPYIKVTLDDGNNTGSTFTNNIGNYTFYTQAGNFTLTPQVENLSYFNFSPPNAMANFPETDNSTQTQNFCITPNGFHPDLEVILVPINNARPGFDATYKIIYKNKGNQALSGLVNLIFDDNRTDFVSSTPNINSQTANQLFWDFSNLLPFETRVIDLILNINSPLENPAVNAEDILDFFAGINLFEGDETPEDNIYQLHQTVRNAQDPNDKTCLEGNVISASEIGKYVHYNINFENVGTASAVNIVVKDIIDTTKFDISSLQLLYTSHPVQTKILGNLVEFIFENINLQPSNIPPGGHGNVLFKLKTLPTLQIGDEIANTANIFFDYNAPIMTNEARSAYQNLSAGGFVKDHSISVYPNPTKNIISIKADSNLRSIELYDVQGRILQRKYEDKNNVTFDISDQANGIYFIKINSEKGSSVEKIIKE